MDAMEGIDQDDIRKNIRIAEERGVDQDTLDAAAQRIETIDQMHTAQEELMTAIDRLDYDRLEAALQVVEELELDEFLSEEVLTRAVERFGFLGRRRNAHNTLHSSIDDFNLDDLLANLEAARSYDVDSEVLQRGEDRVAQLRRMRSEATTELAAAVRTRDVERVTEALLQVERLNAAEAPVLREGHDRLEHLVLMENASEQLRQAIQGHHLHRIQSKLATATALDADPGLLSRGQDRVAQLTAMAESVAVLEVAIAGTDTPRLIEALSLASELGAVSDHLESRATTRLTMLVEVDEAANQLRAVFTSDDSSAVRHALARARELGVDQHLIDEGERTKRRISQLKHDLRSTLLDLTENGTNAHELQRLINECSRLHAASHRRIEAAERRLASLG